MGDGALRLLLVDNYDSFTWNLAQYLEELGARVEVRYNDEVPPARVLGDGLDALVISPGPGRPEHSGATLDLVRAAAGRLPLLGVCLGHQAIAQVHGGRIVPAPAPMHGKTSRIEHDGTGLFAGLPQGFEATRYHSLMVDPAAMDPALRVNARSEDGVVMGLEHGRRALFGVQFHPESVLTVEGKRLLGNFLDLARRWNAAAGRGGRGGAVTGAVVRGVCAGLPGRGNGGKHTRPASATEVRSVSQLKPFNLKAWIDEHRHLLKPPVGNRMVWKDSELMVMVVGGPNQRADFHVEDGEEFFYQVEGDIVLRVIEDGGVRDIPIREGEIFLLPPRIPHSPQRPANTVGLVIERVRAAGEHDHLRWYCPGCGAVLHDAEFELQDLGSQLKPLIEGFFADEVKRTCRRCGAVMAVPR